MPRGDGTGPAGQGPRTGRGMGYCAGFGVPGFMNPGFGRGFGRGPFWRGFSQPIITQPQPITEADEKKVLQENLEILKEEMKEMEKRLKELK